jgi:thioesterase domain-containing protein
MKEVKICQQRALRDFRPRFYEGKIKFIRAAIPSFFPSNPVAVWARYAGTFEIETVPGDHLRILDAHSERVASTLSRYVEEALSQHPYSTDHGSVGMMP